jgi:hypothetical protein
VRYRVMTVAGLGLGHHCHGGPTGRVTRTAGHRQGHGGGKALGGRGSVRLGHAQAASDWDWQLQEVEAEVAERRNGGHGPNSLSLRLPLGLAVH